MTARSSSPKSGDRTSRSSPDQLHPAVAILPAAGKGERAGLPDSKILYPLAGVPVLIRTLRALHDCASLKSIAVVVAASDMDRVRALLDSPSPDPRGGAPLDRIAAIVPGGASRFESVRRGLEALLAGPHGSGGGADPIVVVHDGARPFVSPRLVEEAIARARTHGAAVAALPVSDTLKEADGEGRVLRTIDRRGLWAMQTPQAFRLSLLAEAYARFGNRPTEPLTDDASLVELLGHPVHLFPGDPMNIKLTTAEDLALAELFARRDAVPTPGPRVGIGYDVHPLRAGRPLILGGVRIESDLGLDGHSDADVLVHAICDALLGAAALGDIGQHFPDTDPQYRGISSLTLLERVAERVRDCGFRIVNIDGVVIAQSPRLAPYIADMRRSIAGILRISCDAVSIKATTTEGLGFEGAGEGISAHAVASLQMIS